MFFWIDIGIFVLLLFCLALVCVFEFVNGSHDTANAVSPVIYSHSLKPKKAVILAASMNFLWVTLWWIWVAMGIIHLLPLDVIAEQWSTFWICVVLSLLLTAIIWNAGTWYLWLPASSSHTLIGSIFWVGLAITFLPIVGQNDVSLNWNKVIEVIESLLISPMIGFWVAFWVMTLAYLYIRKKDEIFDTPKKKEAPETWLRALLIAASSWVSFAHGSNDGQKWVGLAMLILISLIPNIFAVNPKVTISSLKTDISYIQNSIQQNISLLPEWEWKNTLLEIDSHVNKLALTIENPETSANDIRTSILLLQSDLKKIQTSSDIFLQAQASWLENTLESEDFKKHTQNLYDTIDYAPWWIIAMISISLWLWTMFWRKRIVKTLGKKIWNHKMNYAESTSSALITALTITIASRLHLPVSTTHIFSSSIAWCMMTGKKPWIQEDTVKHILLAWLLTLPITIIIAWILFSLFWVIFL
jgi:inorganic phosphate transporter, PiT family